MQKERKNVVAVSCPPCEENVALATKREAYKGFTLIELLVVVLIIGILAAIAVPQYQKAAEKSRATQALTLINTLVQAQKAYYLAHGEYATKFEQLDVAIPLTGNTPWHKAPNPNQFADTRSNQEWSVQLFTDTLNLVNGIFVGRISGPYQGASFAYYFHNNYNTALPLNKILCSENTSQDTSVSFTQTTGSYCKKIMNGTLVPNLTTSYTLP